MTALLIVGGVIAGIGIGAIGMTFYLCWDWIK